VGYTGQQNLVYCAILLRHGEPGGRRAAKHLVLRRYHNEPDPARLGFLKAVKDGNSKRITGFVRTVSWPPPPTFFSQGAIGVAHYIQKWFRFKLQEDPLEMARFHSPRVMPEANLQRPRPPPAECLQIFDRDWPRIEISL
jgi:hypothetical protein